MTTGGTGRSAASTPPPPPYPSDATSDQIRGDIRRTRADMDETVDALGERLRPRHLLDDLLDLFKGSSSSPVAGGTDTTQKAKEIGSAAFQRLKNHPMPAALIGAGVAWLLFDQASDGGPSRSDVRGRWRDDELREHSGSYVDARTGEPYDPSYGASYRSGGGAGGGDMGQGHQGQGGPGMMDRASESAKGAAESVSGAASSAADKASDLASRAGDAASQYAHQAREWSAGVYDTTSRGMGRGYEAGRQTFERSLNEYPLAVVAASMAAGVLTGLLLPGTRREDELMGEQSEAIKRQARETGQDLVERGKEVAGSTADAVTDEAHKQGLTPDNLAEKAKHVARDVAGAARESAKREGLDELPQKGKAVAERGKEAAKNEARQQKDKPAPR